MKSCNIFQHRAGHRKNFNEVVKHEKRMKCVELQPRLLLIKMRFSVVYVYSFLSFFSFLFCSRVNIFMVLYIEGRIIAKALLSQLKQRNKVYVFWQR